MSFTRPLVVALAGATVSGLLFARGGLRPWQAVPVGLSVSLVVAVAWALATRRR